jgi:hypothetical protein
MSPPWAPPFEDDNDKNMAFYALPKEIQDQAMTEIQDKDELWRFIQSKTEELKTSLTGGGANVFSDPNINAAFNRLSGSSQAQILQLSGRQRDIVMKQIMERSTAANNDNDNILTGGNNNNNNNNNNNDPLSGAFKALPVDKQFVALQGGYTSMAKEFNNLSKGGTSPFTQIIRPISITEQIAKEYPLVSVDDKNASPEDINEPTVSNDISNTNESNNINDSTVKNITFT